MCGIFGFVLAKPVQLTEVFAVLESLEIHQYPGEETPVGGFAAGIAILRNGELSVVKTGKMRDTSPVRELTKLVKAVEASVLISHVRMPSPEFMDTAYQVETAQPYVASCFGSLRLASVHNGFIGNYKVLQQKLGEGHRFESDGVGLIDSEVVPHCFEEALRANADVEEALHVLSELLEGRMAIALLQTGQRGSYLHFVHKGQTRGLHVWVNDRGEVVFCSRKETLTRFFRDILAQGRFNATVSVKWKEEKDIKLSIAVKG